MNRKMLCLNEGLDGFLALIVHRHGDDRESF